MIVFSFRRAFLLHGYKCVQRWMTTEQYWEVGTEMDNGYLRTDMDKMGKTCTKSEEKNERLGILHKQF